jgi:hypothetical protein
MDRFLSEKKPKKLSYFRVMSDSIHEKLKRAFQEMKKKEGPLIETYGSDNFNSYTSYAIYKSHKGDVYIVEIFTGELSAYGLAKGEEWFFE